MKKDEKKTQGEPHSRTEAERDAAVDEEVLPGTDEINSEPQAPETVAEERSELEIAQGAAADWQDKYLRKAAEFDNYRKRTRLESEMLGQMVAESLIASLLPVMDDFDRMLSGINDQDDPYRKGMEMIRNKLWTFFESRGVAKCDCVGQPFDPNEHDALLMKPTPDFPAGTILEVITPGYRMGERVIRHAQVIVSAEAEAEDDSNDE